MFGHVRLQPQANRTRQTNRPAFLVKSLAMLGYLAAVKPGAPAEKRMKDILEWRFADASKGVSA
jgi:hypothetical protein